MIKNPENHSITPQKEIQSTVNPLIEVSPMLQSTIESYFDPVTPIPFNSFVSQVTPIIADNFHVTGDITVSLYFLYRTNKIPFDLFLETLKEEN